MWLNDTSDYALNNNEAIKKQNENLKSELADLVREIETNELVYGLTFTRPFSSIASVKNDAQLLENERKYFIEKLIQVNNNYLVYSLSLSLFFFLLSFMFQLNSKTYLLSF